MKTNNPNDLTQELLVAVDPAAQTSDDDLHGSRVRSLAIATELGSPVLTGPPTILPRSTRTKPIIRRTVLVAAAAALVASALVATDAVNLLWRPPATAEASEALNTAAQRTVTISDPKPLPGEYLRVDTRAVALDQGDGGSGRLYWLETQNRQLYVPEDRNNLWIMSSEPTQLFTFFGNDTEAAIRELEAGTPKSRTEHGLVQRVAAILSDDELAALPRDPGELLDVIRSKSEERADSSDNQAFVWISDHLRSGTVPADLRAALYRAAALIPGVTLVDSQTNLNGRTGTAIGRIDERNNSRHDMIVDSVTGQFIGERVITLDGFGDVPPGTAIAWTAITTSVVASAPTPER
ncbi:CU044_5270 family protein [Paenarthrobacter sp. NPDC018779]|uniref:CU044_5270 family protein n=1 Tax=Paenarthrobacter sp. NPDC018779 TaxID=3364375 RepID=UPI0037CA03A5